MRADRAIAELVDLKAEAEADPLHLKGIRQAGWEARVKSVIRRSLGDRHPLLDAIDAVKYNLSIWTDMTPDSEWNAAFIGGVRRACGLIDAAIYELGLDLDEQAEEPINSTMYDTDLWDHVKGLVAADEWDKIPAATAIFLEHRVREWTGQQPGVIGKDLYAKTLRDDSEWRLGRLGGESEGWRFLGMGFAQALSNVDRHRIQERADAKQYAVGVLGLGSLLLTQLRHEHPGLVGGPG